MGLGEVIVNGSIPLGAPCANVSEILANCKSCSFVYASFEYIKSDLTTAMATDALDPKPLPGGIDDFIRINKSLYGICKIFNVCLIVLTIPANDFGADSIGP